MKVKDLIAILETMPKNLTIYTADHDHGTFETNSTVRSCELINKSEMTEYDNDKYTYNGDTPFTGTPKKYVVIRG